MNLSSIRAEVERLKKAAAGTDTVPLRFVWMEGLPGDETSGPIRHEIPRADLRRMLADGRAVGPVRVDVEAGRVHYDEGGEYVHVLPDMGDPFEDVD